MAEVRDALDKRDHRDSTREVSPLRPAPDAYVIDTSDMSLDAVVAEVLTEVDSRSNWPRLH